MRILTFLNSLALRSGGPRVHFEILRELAGRGHEVDLVHGTGGETHYSYAEFCRSLLPIEPRGDGDVFAPGFRLPVLRSARAALGGDHDIVYIIGHRHLPHGALVSMAQRIPLVSHLHVPPPARFPPETLAALPRVNRFIAVSDAVRTAAIDAGYPAESLDLVYNGVDLEEYRPGDGSGGRRVRSELHIPADALVALYLGRLDRVKNLETLLAAWNHLAPAPDAARLLVVGDPRVHASAAAAAAYRASLQRLADPSTVSWLPATPDVLPFYEAADVVVLPSLREPFGRVVIEAMACERPVIGAAVDGIKEIMTDEFASYLFDPSDADELVRLLRVLGSWRSTDPELGARARRHVEQRFAAAVTFDGVEASLVRAVACPERHRPAWGALWQRRPSWRSASQPPPSRSR